jgi:putative heme-binding domain-containing protein
MNLMKTLRLLCVVPLVAALGWPVARAQNDDTLPPLVQLLSESDDAQFQLDLLKGMSDGLKGRRAVAMPAGWEKAAAKLGRSPHPQVRALAQALSVTFGSRAAFASLRQTLLDPKADAGARQSALDSLLQARDPTLAAALKELLKDPALRGPALRGLAAYDDAEAPAAIVAVYGSLSLTEKHDALTTLVARIPSARQLLAALAENKIAKRDLTADLVRQLRNLKDPFLNQQVEQLWGAVRESDADKLAEIAKYKAMLTSGPAGSASRGREVFSRVCQQCHTLFDTGGKVGPDITGSNRGDLDYILQHVLDPNAVIPNDYRTWTLETKDERVITGIVTRQDDIAVTIVTANETLLIPRAEVRSLQQSEISMMPEGLLQALTDAEVRDLIAYLKSPAQVPLPDAAGK